MCWGRKATGSRCRVSGAPGFFVNGRFIYGALPLGTFEGVINEILQEAGR